MLLKSLLTKFRNPWIWGASLTLFFGASAWGVEQGLMTPRIQQERDWNLESRRLERRVRKTLPQFPDLERLHRRLNQQQSKLNGLQKEVAALDGWVLPTNALIGRLKEAEAEGGALSVVRMGTGKDACRVKPYVCDTFEIQGRRKFGALVNYLDSLERSSPMLEIQSLKIIARGGGGDEPPEVKIRLDTTHSPVKKGDAQRFQASHPESFSSPLIFSPQLPAEPRNG